MDPQRDVEGAADTDPEKDEFCEDDSSGEVVGEKLGGVEADSLTE